MRKIKVGDSQKGHKGYLDKKKGNNVGHKNMKSDNATEVSSGGLDALKPHYTNIQFKCWIMTKELIT